MALPLKYRLSTTVITKSIKFVSKYAPVIGAVVGAVVGKNIKEKYETLEEYKGWEIWKQGKAYYAKKNKNKFKLNTNDINNIKALIDRYEENDDFEYEEDIAE